METMEKKPLKTKRPVKEHGHPYREKFEMLEEKFEKIKDILKQVLKDLTEEKKKQELLATEHQNLVLELKEKDALLERMQSVSEAVIDEYTVLSVKCELEVEAATNASKRASKYFEENQKLKRSQHEILDPHISDSNELCCLESSVDESTPELELLHDQASELRTEIASLKVELMKEIEKQDSLMQDFEIAKELYEQEVKEHKFTKEKLLSLELNNIVHKKASHDPENIESCVEQCTVGNEDEQENISMKCLESLDNSYVLAENLKLAEEQIENFKHQNKALNTRIQELEFENCKLRAEASASTALPILPPPPPPPLPPSSFNPIKSFITFIHAGKKSAKVKKENSETQHQKAMSEMIDAIKKGQVHLKPTPKPLPQSAAKEETALGEMKSILSSLKRKDSICKEGIKDDASQVLESTTHFDEYRNQACASFNISAEVDEELKLLLRKRSLKNLCETPLAEIKPHSSDTLDPCQLEYDIPSLNDSVISSESSNYPIQSKEECHVSSEVDTNSSENQDNIIQMPENAITTEFEVKL